MFTNHKTHQLCCTDLLGHPSLVRKNIGYPVEKDGSREKRSFSMRGKLQPFL